MKPIMKLTLIFFIMITASGCWDVKNITYFNFVNAIGIDYAEGKYKIYAQINDLASMAKQSGPGQVLHPIVIAKGEGESVGLALFNLQKLSQTRTDWTQNKVFIFSRNALEKGLLELNDELMRTRDQRYSPWVYTTKEDMEKMLNIQPVMGTSSIATLMYQPNYLFKQQSTVEPLHYQQLIRSSREPHDTILLIQLGVKESWVKGESTIPLAFVDDVVALHKGKSQGEFSREEIAGTKWLNEATNRGVLPIKDDDGNFIAAVALRTDHVKKKPKYQNGKKMIEVYVKLSGNLKEQRKLLEINELESMIKKTVIKEIKSTYELGKKRSVDLFAFNETWYRKGLETVEGDIPEPELHVDVHLVHSNMFELRK